MLSFETNDKAYEWLMMASIYTLMGLQFINNPTNNNSNTQK
jgi:hypothetical protein